MPQWARQVMDQKTADIVGQFDVTSLDALEISGSHWGRYQWKSYSVLEYPSFDICLDAVYDRQFDIVFAEQVFEHLIYPYRATRNVWRMLRPGGYFLVTLPFLIRIHPNPTDCTRWTPQGLTYFLEECGFDRGRIRVDSWGNRACVLANFSSWVEFEPGLHSLENEPGVPVVVWALAQK
jgi:SAM-dependent methyltransferase